MSSTTFRAVARRLALLAAVLRAATAAAVPVPSVTTTDPGEVFQGSSFTSEVCLKNTGSVGSTGFAPELGLVIPAGVTLTGATFQGQAIQPTAIQTCGDPAGCTFTDPASGLSVTVAEGETALTLSYPIGSVGTDLVPLCMDLSFTLAGPPTTSVGSPLQIGVIPIFSLGADGTDDPGTDPPITGGRQDLTVIPTVFKVEKSMAAPEGETATGPNFPRTVSLAVMVAPGESVENVIVQDVLPPSLQFQALTDAAGCSPTQLPSTSEPGGTLKLDCGTVSTDRTITFTVFVPDLDASGVPVLSHTSPGARPIVNDGKGSADFDDDADSSTPNVTISDDGPATDATITAKAAPIRKSVAIVTDTPPAGLTPGDTLEYTIVLDVSDFFSLTALTLTDRLGDGQTFDTSFAPTFAVRENGVATSGSFSQGTSFAVAPKDAAGQTAVTLDLSRALTDAGRDGILAGDMAADGVIGQGATTATIKFHTTVDAAFSGPVSGTPDLDDGDPIDNSVSLTTQVVGGGLLSPADSSDTTIRVVSPQPFAKSVFAFNGSTTLPNPLLVGAGDTVTFRLRIELSATTFETPMLVDFLPLPLFKATEVVGPSSGGPIPPPGRFGRGPDDTLVPRLPSFSFNADPAQNSLNFSAPAFTPSGPSVFDLLFTVTATTDPFADRLDFLNIATAARTNSFGEPFSEVSSAPVTTRAPQLTITKEIVSSTNGSSGAATPPAGFDAAWQNADGGDRITFRLHVENHGSREADDVRLQDRWVQQGVAGQGYSSCTIDSVTDGAGTALPTTGDLFAGTLALTNPLPANSNQTLDPNEQALVTFTCTVNPIFSPGQPIDDTAALTNYSAIPGGPNYATNTLLLRRMARVSLRGITGITKQITASSLPGSTPNSNVNRGEQLTFQIVTTLSEGTYPGFALTDNTTAIPSPLTCGSGGVVCSPNVSASGTTVTVASTPQSTSGTITYTYTQQKTASGTNTAAVKSSNDPGGTASTSWTLDDPNPTITKTLTPSSVQAGDVVTVALQFGNNDTTNPMFQCVVTDVLDPNIWNLGSVAAGTTPTGYAFSYDQASGTVRYTATDTTTACPPGSATFTATIRSDVTTGSNAQNSASIRARTLPSNHPNEAAGGNVSATSTKPITILSATSKGKIITATSESSTDPGDASVASTPPVAIGEVITYSISFGFPQGVTRNVVLSDLLPAGLTLIAGTTTLDRSGTDITTATNPGNINAGTPGTPVPVGAALAGNQLSLSLGDVTKAVGGGTGQLTLALQAVVANVATNNAGATLTDTASLSFTPLSGTAVTVNTNAVAVRVAEPVVRVTKQAEPTSASAGDPVTFTLDITNGASGGTEASAFDWTFSDPLPARYLSPVLVSVDPGTTGAVATASFTGNTLSGTIDQLDPGETVRITYTAQVDPSANFAETITNTAVAKATSLPGARGTASATPGAPGAPNGERDASGGVNDLDSQGSATVTVNQPVLAKSLQQPQAFYAVGEMPVFGLQIGAPRGTTDRMVVRDVLPAGLTFKAGSLQAHLADQITTSRGVRFLDETTPGFVTVSGNTLILDFGTVTATRAGNINVTYTTTVDNVIGNQDGTLLANDASLAFADPTDPARDISVAPTQTADPVRVGEPNLFMTKNVTAGATGSQAGDTVSFEVSVTNRGNTTAFRLDWTDTLPIGASGITNARLRTQGGDVFLNGTGTSVTSSNLHVTTTARPGDTLDLASTTAGDAADTVQLAPGASIVIDFDCVLENTVTPAQVLNNVASASYASLLSGGRDGSNGGDDDTDDRLNNYNETGTTSVTVASPVNVQKTVTPNRYAVGTLVTFTHRVDVIQGTTPSLVFTDVLPAGLTFVSQAITVGNQGMTLGNSTYNTRLGTGQTVSFDLGDIGNPSNGITTDDFVGIDITAHVDNVAANQNGTVLRNGEAADGSQVFVTFNGGTRVDFDADPATPGAQGRQITVLEPALGVTKTASPTDPALGKVVTYTVTVRHLAASRSDAFDLVLTDTLPAGLHYVDGSATLPPANVTVAGQTLTFRAAGLPLVLGAQSFSYQATVDPSAAVGTPLTNDAQLVWSSTPGATGAADDGRTGQDGVGGLNDYVAGTAAPVTPNAATLVEATKTVLDTNGGMLEPGDTLEYTVVLTSPITNVTGVVFQDPVPQNTTYVPGTLQSTAGTVDDSGAPLLRVAVGPMAQGAAVTITFRVTVNLGVAAGTIIVNQGVVDSNETVPEPTDADGVDANGDQPTTIVVGPVVQPQNPLYVQKGVQLFSDLDGNGVVTAGDVLRYTLIFSNTGTTTLTNVALTDTIPTGLTSTVPAQTTITGSGNQITVTGQSVAVTIPSLNVGEFVSATFLVTVVSPLVNLDGNPSQETFTNQATATADGVGPTPSDSNGSPADGNQPTSIVAVADATVPTSPLMDVQKRAILALDRNADGIVNPNDIIFYTIIVRNTGATSATDVRLNDPTPNNTTVVPGSVVTSQGVVLSETPVSVNLGTLAPGAAATISYLASVNPGTPDGTILANQAIASGSNFPSEPSDDNGNPADGKNPTLVPVGTQTGPNGLTKTLQATSEAESPGASVVIGEVETFRITFSVPPGRTRQVTINDVLPAGLSYLPATAMLARQFAVGLTAAQNPGGINAAAAGVFVPLADGADVTLNGQELQVFLGDVISSDASAQTASYVLQLQAVVLNAGGNQAGTPLVNQGTVSFVTSLQQAVTTAPALQPSIVTEPNVQVVKAAEPLSLLTTGGTVTFTVTVTNVGGPFVSAGVRRPRHRHPGGPVWRIDGGVRHAERPGGGRDRREHHADARCLGRSPAAGRPGRHRLSGVGAAAGRGHTAAEHRGGDVDQRARPAGHRQRDSRRAGVRHGRADR